MRALLGCGGILCSLLLGCGDGNDGDGKEPPAPSAALEASTLLDLTAVKKQPDDYEWFDFRPNVQKLILAGAAEGKHVAILWYTVEDGAVGLHYHAQTESVYVIDGTQTDAKGVYETGTAYFNPPGSGHEISDSSGFFLLAYAAPPDFMATDKIEPYSPVRLETEDESVVDDYPFEEQAEGARVFAVPLDSDGGLSAELIRAASGESRELLANYVLVLEGSCEVEGEPFDEDWLLVAKSVEGERYRVSGGKDECLALAVAFR